MTHLPIGCALHRAEDPHGYGAGWTHLESLSALMIEVLDRHDRNFVIANSKRGSRKPKPLRIPRPGESKKKRNATGDELAAMVGKLGGMKVGPMRDVYRDDRGRLHDRATGRYVKEA